MKKSVLWIVATVLLAAGSHLTCAATALLSTSLATKATPGDRKHTIKYIRQRVDDIYRCYKNPQYDEYGARIMERINLDSAYCSDRYKATYSKVWEMTEDELVIDYDHWTGSQDDNQFTYRVGKIENITDSTAIAYVEGNNFGEDCTIVLSLLFERGDWYVDDFLPIGGESERAYLERLISESIISKIIRFYEDYVFYGKDDLTIEEAVKKYCTPRLVQKLKDDYEYEGEGYAIWDFRGPLWGPGDSIAHKVDAVSPLGNGKYKVCYYDGDEEFTCTVSVIVKGNTILFDGIE
ncbi:MAG: hypothetical protein J5637_02520 [Prevotella sp.]|nr:hypothetical protein [Prevotella sp.]